MSTVADIKPSTMPQTMAWLGAAAIVIGGIIMGVANKRKEAREDVQKLRDAMLGWDYVPGEAIQSLVAWGHFGLGVLIFGALLAVTGLAVTAARR